jgi:putative ATPase
VLPIICEGLYLNRCALKVGTVLDLFESASARLQQATAPLASRMRPQSFDEYLGQSHVLGAATRLRQSIEQDRVPSMLIWGPPGTGKTSLAQIIASKTKAALDIVSAVHAGVKDIKEAIVQAKERRRLHNQKSILFVDEIHRFNKGQQDALLPHVENGTVVLIGATTENPSFEVNSALLSRVTVVALRPLDSLDVKTLLDRALSSPHGLAGQFEVDHNALTFLANASEGDARKALGALELACVKTGEPVTMAHVQEALQHWALSYDRQGAEHHGVASAFIKSMRASDPDAALYWLARMVESGEPVRFIVRRMVVFASEDIGNADPRALSLTTSCLQAVELLGLPEATHALAQTAAYLALAPKSNAAYQAYLAAKAAVEAHGTLPVPHFLLNATSATARQLGHGQGYVYPHDHPEAPGQDCLPTALRQQRFYRPKAVGEEAELQQRLERIRRERAVGEPGEDG